MPKKNHTTSAKPGEQSGLAEPICSAVPLPHEYAYSHETPSRKLWDEDDMRDYAAAVLKDANDMCRSALQIARREQQRLAFQPHQQENATNWSGFIKCLEESLARQHAIMYPLNKD